MFSDCSVTSGSYTLTGLAPATTYTVRVDAQTQLGYGFVCCVPTATTDNGETSFDACMESHGDCGTLISINVTAMFLVYSMHSIVLMYDSLIAMSFCINYFDSLVPRTPLAHVVTCYIPQSGKCVTFLAAVCAPQGVSLERLILQGAVRVTWSPPTDLCGLTNPQYTIQYGRTTSTPTTHPSTPSP